MYIIMYIFNFVNTFSEENISKTEGRRFDLFSLPTDVGSLAESPRGLFFLWKFLSFLIQPLCNQSGNLQETFRGFFILKPPPTEVGLLPTGGNRPSVGLLPATVKKNSALPKFCTLK